MRARRVRNKPDILSYSWKEAAADLQERFYDEFGVLSEECPQLNDKFDSARNCGIPLSRVN